jgi:hypothetical protein
MNTIERLIPPLEEHGEVIVCNPLGGYPLKAVTYLNGFELDKIGLYQCGKNLIPPIATTKDQNGVMLVPRDDGSIYVHGTSSNP